MSVWERVPDCDCVCACDFDLTKLVDDSVTTMSYPSYDFLSLYYVALPSFYTFPRRLPPLLVFFKKRQWQDLNLRIQRIIDFKSIALDHSATLSYTTLLYFPLPDIYDYTRDKTWHPNIHDNIYAPTIPLYHLTLKMLALTPAPLLYISNLQ